MLKKSLQATAFISTLMMSVGTVSPVVSQAATAKQNKVQDIDKINANSAKKQASKKVGEVKVSLNFRKGASTASKVIRVFKKGEKVKILLKSGDWYKVESSEGKVGWCNSKYIKVLDNKTNDTNGTFKNTANVRKGASTKYSVIATLKKNQKVKVISSLNGWYKIECPNGKIGWVHGSHIKTSVKLYPQKEPNKNQSNSKNEIQYGAISGNKMVVSATAYSGHTITATGTRPKFGTIAVDPKVIPYGTKVYIPRFGKTFIAEDCGGGIKGNKIDIFMNSKAECREWGVRTITIHILK